MIRILFALLFACTVLLSACTHKFGVTAKKPLPVAKPIVQTRPLAAFSRISVEGVVDLRLHTGATKPHVVVRGDARDLEKLFTSVKDNTLVLRLTIMPKFGRVSVDVYTPRIYNFRYKGAGVVLADPINASALDLYIDNPEKTRFVGSMHLNTLDVQGKSLVEVVGVNSPYLKVRMKGNPHVQLVGVARLASLDIQGAGWFGLYWVSNDWLEVKAQGASVVQLAGVANVLDLNLKGRARFNGRHLRAARTFVKTYDHAVAEINTFDRQHTLATDSSDIYFYNVPMTKNDFMACNGAVLDMRDWDIPDLEEYTRYNKDVALGDW